MSKAPIGIPLEDLLKLEAQYKEKVAFFSGGLAAIQQLIEFCQDDKDGHTGKKESAQGQGK